MLVAVQQANSVHGWPSGQLERLEGTHRSLALHASGSEEQSVRQ
jgi:hypothetical protein